jgi:hypothetical protein
MICFPQTANGAVSQFPVRRSRVWRPILNQLESGERIMLNDSAANELRWQLSMKDLSDAEAGSMAALFQSVQGQYGSFLFVDPMANLLGWSEDLSKPDWQLGLLTAAPGVSDRAGTTRASRLTNPTAGEQSLQQSVAIPASYIACFSAWLRSDVSTTVTISRDSHSVSAAIGPMWKRVYVSGRGDDAATGSTFSLSLAAGQTVSVWGLQLEVQPYPSKYKQTASARGVYEQTYFGSDELDITSTAPGLYSCEVSVVSRG